MIAPSFINSKWSLLNILVAGHGAEHVADLCRFVIDMTRKPSITASSAFVGSISVMITSAPLPRARLASPRPHHRSRQRRTSIPPAGSWWHE